jgi:hypothetical protein
MKLPVLVSLLLTLVCTASKKPNIIYILADEKPEGSTKPHPKKRK